MSSLRCSEPHIMQSHTQTQHSRPLNTRVSMFATSEPLLIISIQTITQKVVGLQSILSGNFRLTSCKISTRQHFYALPKSCRAQRKIQHMERNGVFHEDWCGSVSQDGGASLQAPNCGICRSFFGSTCSRN